MLLICLCSLMLLSVSVYAEETGDPAASVPADAGSGTTKDDFPVYNLSAADADSYKEMNAVNRIIDMAYNPDIYVDTAQTLTMHHNYFANMEARGVLARHGKLHAYNNFFYDVKLAGIECTDSSSCYIEGNVLKKEKPVELSYWFKL